MVGSNLCSIAMTNNKFKIWLLDSADTNEDFPKADNLSEFIIGFIFDGHDEYRNLYNARPPANLSIDIFILHVYDNPIISSFNDDAGSQILVGYLILRSYNLCVSENGRRLFEPHTNLTSMLTLT